MARELGQTGAALLALAALLGGCTTLDSRDWNFADSGSGGMFRAAWGGTRTDRAEPSDMVQRVRGVEAPREPLQLEPGNVWPVEEAPRATLANPDAALRGVPAYRPGETRNPDRLWNDDRQSEPGPRADAAPADDSRRPLRQRRGASSPPPPPLVQPEPSRVEAPPLPPYANQPPPRRADGQVILPPVGGPVVTSGGTDRIQSFTTPGGGGGVIHRDGGVTTISPSGGIPQTFVTPR